MAYRKESLGRMASFLLPSVQLKAHDEKGVVLEEHIHQFLLGNFNGYTAQTGNILGWWKDATGRVHYGEHKAYKVSFEGIDRIPVLEEFLARLALQIKEECIYLEIGEDGWLIYPESE